MSTVKVRANAQANSYRSTPARISPAIVATPENYARRIPPSVPADQLFLWSDVWLAGEFDSADARAAGETVRFDSDDPNDIVHWLFSTED